MTDNGAERRAAGRKEPDLSTDIGGIRMKNPVMVASGTFGFGPEYADLVEPDRLGGVIVKGISLDPAAGNEPPRLVEVPCGLINSIGLQNPGVEYFVREYMPFLRDCGTTVIVNIWGRSIEEYRLVAIRLSEAGGVDGLELNLSCPNIREGGAAFGTDARLLRQVVTEVRASTDLPLIVKLSPNVPDIGELAVICEQAGADVVSLINTLPAMAVDVETRRPRLGNISGGLSGPAIHPVAVKMVWEATRACALPVIGVGGVSSLADALEFFIVGARAVAVGTATFSNPRCALEIVDGLREYLVGRGLAGMDDLIGTLET